VLDGQLLALPAQDILRIHLTPPPTRRWLIRVAPGWHGKSAVEDPAGTRRLWITAPGCQSRLL
jgi:hypothetical protein